MASGADEGAAAPAMKRGAVRASSLAGWATPVTGSNLEEDVGTALQRTAAYFASWRLPATCNHTLASATATAAHTAAHFAQWLPTHRVARVDAHVAVLAQQSFIVLAENGGEASADDAADHLGAMFSNKEYTIRLEVVRRADNLLFGRCKSFTPGMRPRLKPLTKRTVCSNDKTVVTAHREVHESPQLARLGKGHCQGPLFIALVR